MAPRITDGPGNLFRGAVSLLRLSSAVCEPGQERIALAEPVGAPRKNVPLPCDGGRLWLRGLGLPVHRGVLPGDLAPVDWALCSPGCRDCRRYLLAEEDPAPDPRACRAGGFVRPAFGRDDHSRTLIAVASQLSEPGVHPSR